MSDEKQDKQGLPFRLFDSVLGRMKKLVDTGSEVARANITRSAATAPQSDDGAASAREADEPKAADVSERASTGAADGTDVLDAPAPSETATASAALATALDEEAKAAIAKHAGEDGEVTDGLAIKDRSGRVPPDEELGPEPFTPQVGP